jgi:D-alanyl-D-alanine carboxypeptidase
VEIDFGRAADVAANCGGLEAIRVLGTGPAPFALVARSAMLTEFHSGEVLYAYNGHMRMQPASLAKIMTFYITLEALQNRKLTLDTPVTISEKAWRLSVDETVSKMFLEVGQQVPVKQLLYGMMVSSGNDAAMALAEYLAGCGKTSFVGKFLIRARISTLGGDCDQARKVRRGGPWLLLMGIFRVQIPHFPPFSRSGRS